MNSLFKVHIGLCCLLLSSFSNAKVHYPCSGVPGAYRANPDTTPGGFVASTATVDATIFVGPEASICERSTVIEGAKILDEAVISGTATVRGKVQVGQTSKIFGDAYLMNLGGDSMFISGSAKVYGRAFLQGSIIVSDSSEVHGWAKIIDFVQLLGSTTVCGSAIIKGFEVLTDDQSHCVQK